MFFRYQEQSHKATCGRDNQLEHSLADGIQPRSSVPPKPTAFLNTTSASIQRQLHTIYYTRCQTRATTRRARQVLHGNRYRLQNNRSQRPKLIKTHWRPQSDSWRRMTFETHPLTKRSRFWKAKVSKVRIYRGYWASQAMPKQQLQRCIWLFPACKTETNRTIANNARNWAAPRPVHYFSSAGTILYPE